MSRQTPKSRSRWVYLWNTPCRKEWIFKFPFWLENWSSCDCYHGQGMPRKKILGYIWIWSIFTICPTISSWDTEIENLLCRKTGKILLGTPKSGGKGKTNKKVGLENGCYLGHSLGPRALGRFCMVFFRKKIHPEVVNVLENLRSATAASQFQVFP